MSRLPARPVRLGQWQTLAEQRADGTTLLRATEPLGPYPGFLAERLIHWAEVAPERTFLAERDAAGGWRRISYAATLTQVRRIAQALLARGLNAETPIAALSENEIAQALLTLAAHYVGVPIAPISPAYSLLSRDFGRLRHVLALIKPRLVYAAEGARFAAALRIAAAPGAEIVCARNAPADIASTPLDDLLATTPTEAIETRRATLRTDDIAKLLFTSGSTGVPKAVINTHRMLCANQQMLQQVLAFLAEEPPVLVDWLPWHHTFGGNHNVNATLYNGGTLYIDAGRPTPEGMPTTIANLREIAPTVYFNVPRGYEALLHHLRQDTALARTFFSRVKVLFYAAAALSQPVWDGYAELAHATCGERIVMVTGLGATETAPLSVNSIHDAERPGEIGGPVPGVVAKLVPAGRKLEIRLRGPHVTPGYWRQPELTTRAFDDEGFYRIGDAVRFVDPSDPGRGLLFDGRIAEDFKLATGTWVSVAGLRASIVAALAPVVRDAVITGHDRDEVGALLVPDGEAWREIAPDCATLAEAVRDTRLIAWLQARLDTLAAAATGSSERVARARMLLDPLSLDAGEVTDKGSLNQRAIIERRAALIDALYDATPAPGVIVARYAECPSTGCGR
jgi:feruloyl-CoA synthase